MNFCESRLGRVKANSLNINLERVIPPKSTMPLGWRIEGIITVRKNERCTEKPDLKNHTTNSDCTSKYILYCQLAVSLKRADIDVP